MKPMKLFEATPDIRTKEQFISDEIAEVQGRLIGSGMKLCKGKALKTLKQVFVNEWDVKNG